MSKWIAGVLCLTAAASAQPTATRFAGPTNSQPLSLSANGAFLVVANPDNNTASFFDLRRVRYPASFPGALTRGHSCA